MAWFDRHAEGYDAWYQTELGRYVDAVEKDLLQQVAAPVAGEQALDVGCGTGAHTVWLAEQGLTVVGLDESTAMLEVATTKGSGLAPPPTWLHGDAGSLPFEDDRFDLVVSVAALEFVDDREAALREAARVLRPGGRLVLGLLAHDGPWGELYRQDAADNPDGVFAKARLFRESDLPDLLPRPFTVRRGLYHPPRPDLDRDAADRLERDLQQRQADGAGFFAVRWVKEAS